MAAPTEPEPSLLRIPMSYEEYAALPPYPRHEWVDGAVLMMAANPGPRHNRAARRLAELLEEALPGLWVECDIGIETSPSRHRRPDVVALASAPAGPQEEDAWLSTDVPVLVAEVLSPSTRREDLIRKGPEYAARGVGHYWVVDREAHVIEAMTNVEGEWRTAALVDRQHPVAEVVVGTWGSVVLDLARVLDS